MMYQTKQTLSLDNYNYLQNMTRRVILIPSNTLTMAYFRGYEITPPPMRPQVHNIIRGALTKDSAISPMVRYNVILIQL